MFSILPTELPTDCANIKGLRIKCISDRVRLPTDLPTDCEKYEGPLNKFGAKFKIHRRIFNTSPTE
jgi:hypothetical protein